MPKDHGVGGEGRWSSLLTLLLALLLFPVVVRAQQPSTVAAAHKPNIDIHTYRRDFTPDENISLNLSTYNEKSVRLTLYRFSLQSLTPTSKAVADFGKQIPKLPLRGLPVAKTVSIALGKGYPDQWMEREVKIGKLAPGTYLVVAQGGGAERRSWLASTSVALVAKHSRQGLLVFAADAHSGRPVSGLNLTLTDEAGKRSTAQTGSDGLGRADWPAARGSAWIYGVKNGSPAFLLTGVPPAPDPFTIYTYADRPIYRPGHTVRFKGTIRRRVEADAPGGFHYVNYENQRAVVEIRDSTDALLSKTTVTTGANGSYEGSFQLGPETTLGRWQIVTSIGEFHSYATFEVQSYRKPEFSADVHFDHPHYLGGTTVPVIIEARYYFGQPVARAAVTYQITFQPVAYSRGGTVAPEPPFVGQGVTDAQGRLTLQVQTRRLPLDRRLTIAAVVRDLSRREIPASGTALITGGMFHLQMEPDRSVCRAGQSVGIVVHAADYDDRPVMTPVRVQLIETKYDRDHRPYQEKTIRDVVTGHDGSAVATFTPPRPGYLELEAQAFDSEQNAIGTHSYLWVVGDDDADYDYPTLNLAADRTHYRPGDVATVMLNTNLVTPPGKRTPVKKIQAAGDEPPKPVYHEAWAFITIEGERLYESRLVHLTRRSSTLQIPLTTNEFPSIELSVTLVQEKQIYQQQMRIEVARDDQRLHVVVTPGKERYAPGEAATYTVSTQTVAGKPVPAEVGLGVVDAAVYAIQPDQTPDIEGYFYSGQDIRIQTDFSFAAQYSGGAFQTMPPQTPNAPAPGGVRVRKQFADTAYWNAFVQTGSDGTAQVTFNLPDNLTTWRATAHAITADTRVGSTTADAISTMPLLVRLELPRFYVQGDRTVVSAIVHNYTGAARSVAVRMEATGADLTDDAHRTIEIPAGGEQRLDWQAHITSASAPSFATFRVTADGGADASDAVELSAPVMADGVQMVESQAAVLTKDDDTFTLDTSTLPPDASVTLSLSPTLAGTLINALDDLADRPEGDADDTVSVLLPDIAVSRALGEAGSAGRLHTRVDKWVRMALQKLYRYQHADGGWNWWEFDQTDGDMTADVLYGLIQAREAGYLVDDKRLQRGSAALLALLQNEQEWNRRADWMLTLASVRPEAVAPLLKASFDNREKLDTYGQASLCMAAAEVANRLPAQSAEARSEAATLERALEAVAQHQGTTVFWSASAGGYTWRADDVALTAHVLRAVLTVAPGSPLIPGTVRWLMGRKMERSWDCPRTSAEVIITLARYLGMTHELNPDLTVTVAPDAAGHAQQTWSMRTLGPAKDLTFKPADWHGGHSIVVSRKGRGALYATAVVRYVVASAEAKPVRKGITVHHYYNIVAEDPSKAGAVASGDDVTVRLEITADADYRYATMEEPLPAGFEVAPGDEQYRPMGLAFDRLDQNGLPIAYGGGYVHQEVRDNRVVFFFDDLPKGRTSLTYRLHAETPGEYRILPGTASLVYFPEIRGTAAPARAEIIDREQQP
jgi:uncharacterized protein YfaS (alpha-2-macroglobulin family)